MNGFRNWFGRYMMGRYGSDELNRFLLIVTAILIIAGMFITRPVLNLVVIGLLILIYSRMFSRNIPKRQQENMKYLQMKARVTGGRSGAGRRPSQGFTGARRKSDTDAGKRVYICPNCKGSLKVPVGAGRIRIRCPHCGSTFEETV